MSAYDYKSLKAHVGHKIVCLSYGNKNDPVSVAIECRDCGEVLFDYNKEGKRTIYSHNDWYFKPWLSN